MLRVGQKVVCVNADYTNHPNWVRVLNRPIKDGVYIIRGVAPFYHQVGRPAIYLQEIVNAPAPWEYGGHVLHVEYAFAADRFRPAVERQTDISIFTAMLNKTKEKA
jgi:hypothetical protein